LVKTKEQFAMQKCKKYKPAFPAENHHRNPASDCQSCLYFSKQNCGSHAVPVVE